MTSSSRVPSSSMPLIVQVCTPSVTNGEILTGAKNALNFVWLLNSVIGRVPVRQADRALAHRRPCSRTSNRGRHTDTRGTRAPEAACYT